MWRDANAAQSLLMSGFEGEIALQAFDYFGVLVFAISGALVAVRKNMDIFGLLVLALLPAVGGGTLRDLLLDVPVFWLNDPAYLMLTGCAVLAAFFGHRFLNNARAWIVWADALGLAVFCVLGAAKALALGLDPVVASIMGVMTAVAGGLIRDVVANDIPYVLQEEIYATAALAGAVTYVLLAPWSMATWVAIAVALIVRSLGIVGNWALPRAR